jgi:hypothetical protein
VSTLTVGAALVGIVMFGSLTASMLPFILQRVGFDPASASAPLVATLVDVRGLVIYFTVASLILGGTLLQTGSCFERSASPGLDSYCPISWRSGQATFALARNCQSGA